MKQRHFSMLRDFQLADWFTLGNAFCGTGAVFAAMRFLLEGDVSDLLWGMALIPAAFVLDAFDGRIARWRKVASTLGRELDCWPTSFPLVSPLRRWATPADCRGAGTG